MRILSLLICCLLLVGAPSLAQQPVISSVSVSGPTLTITGANLGTHAKHGGSQPFLNAAWSDFSTAINGGNLTLSNTYPVAWTYMTTGGRTPTKRWARHAHDPNGPDCCTRLGALEHFIQGQPSQFYQTFWLRCGSNVNQAAKFWRIYGDGHDIFLSITNGMDLMSYSNAGGNPAPSTVWAVRPGPVRCASQWERWEIYMRDTAGDDLIEVHVDGQLAFRRGSQLPSNHIDLEGSASNERQQWVTNPWGGNGHTIDFLHLVDGDFFGVSDPFVDYTRMRVELSDGPTWATARHKEIQIPLTWADNRVTAQLNLGSFSPSQTVYAYVVDSNGNVNASGVPIVLGGTTPPPPPTPSPVNCVTGAWSAWAATSPPGACISNQQQVIEERSRIVLTPPSNGGLACGPLSETRTVTQPCTSPPPPPPPVAGCTYGGQVVAVGTSLPAISIAHTRGNVTQETAVSALHDALEAAGFDPGWSKDGAWSFFLPTCRKP